MKRTVPKKRPKDAGRKSPSMSIRFGFAPGTKAAKATITDIGELVFTDDEGKPIVPEYVDRAVYYDRASKPKVQSRRRSASTLASVRGLSELTRYNALCVVDTNTRVIGGKKVSAAGVVCCRIISKGGEFRLDCEKRFRVYEFHDVQGNPELLAILKIANDIRASGGTNVAFINDSALGLHDAINARSVPIYGKYALPDGFHIIYASADTGGEVANGLIRFCDREARKYLQYLERGEIKNVPLVDLDEDCSVKFRLLSRTDIEFSCPPLTGLALQPGSTVTLYGRKK